MKSNKIQFDDITITLRNKGTQVWEYHTTQLSSLIGRTKFPNISEDELIDRLEASAELMRGEKEIYMKDGKFKKRLYKNKKSA